jgi:branched-subunit amino acid transport protein
MGVLAFAARALPQIVFLRRTFPSAWDLFLRYVSYAFICSIISTTLFMSGGRFEFHAAPHRALALLATIVVAHRTKSALIGMIVGAVLLTVLSWVH